jgi:hypothetical protein
MLHKRFNHLGSRSRKALDYYNLLVPSRINRVLRLFIPFVNDVKPSLGTQPRAAVSKVMNCCITTEIILPLSPAHSNVESRLSMLMFLVYVYCLNNNNLIIQWSTRRPKT